MRHTHSKSTVHQQSVCWILVRRRRVARLFQPHTSHIRRATPFNTPIYYLFGIYYVRSCVVCHLLLSIFFLLLQCVIKNERCSHASRSLHPESCRLGIRWKQKCNFSTAGTYFYLFIF